MGTKYVGWDDTCETAAILLVISPLHVAGEAERGGGGKTEEKGGGRGRREERKEEKGSRAEGKITGLGGKSAIDW